MFLADLDEFGLGFVGAGVGGHAGVLRGAPVVDVADLVDAGDGAARGAAFFREELALDVFASVAGEGDARVAALLAAVVDEAVLADVEVACACAAAPVVGLPVGDGFLEVVEAGVAAAGELADLIPDVALALAEGPELTGAVVDDADGGAESEAEGALRDGQSVFRIGRCRRRRRS